MGTKNENKEEEFKGNWFANSDYKITPKGAIFGILMATALGGLTGIGLEKAVNFLQRDYENYKIEGYSVSRYEDKTIIKERGGGIRSLRMIDEDNDGSIDVKYSSVIMGRPPMRARTYYSVSKEDNVLYNSLLDRINKLGDK